MPNEIFYKSTGLFWQQKSAGLFWQKKSPGLFWQGKIRETLSRLSQSTARSSRTGSGTQRSIRNSKTWIFLLSNFFPYQKSNEHTSTSVYKLKRQSLDCFRISRIKARGKPNSAQKALSPAAALKPGFKAFNLFMVYIDD